MFSLSPILVRVDSTTGTIYTMYLKSSKLRDF